MKKTMLVILGFCIICGLTHADDKIDKELNSLPIETVILQPAQLKNVSIWVPATKSGPYINRSCRTKENLSNASILSAVIDHQKDANCPSGFARILAEQVFLSYEKELPLTIFNGWQWEYSFSLSQYNNVGYSLTDHGGSWEDCQEAVLNMTIGQIASSWLTINSSEPELSDNTQAKSTIYLYTFSSMRTRNGYPKVRKL